MIQLYYSAVPKKQHCDFLWQCLHTLTFLLVPEGQCSFLSLGSYPDSQLEIIRTDSFIFTTSPSELVRVKPNIGERGATGAALRMQIGSLSR